MAENNGSKWITVGIAVGSALLAGSGSYFTAMAQVKKNSDELVKLEELPTEVALVKQELRTLKRQQTELKAQVERAADESRQADNMTLTALADIQRSIALLQQKLDED